MNLLKSLAAVSSMTMFSRVLGFIRDAIIARIFGAGMATDAFFVAFKLPNLLRRIFAEGAFSQAFVPILAEYKSQQERGNSYLYCLCIGNADVDLSDCHSNRDSCRTVGY
ncbi:lipid II flippase MurJ [Proteus mirabilis]